MTVHVSVHASDLVDVVRHPHATTHGMARPTLGVREGRSHGSIPTTGLVAERGSGRTTIQTTQGAAVVATRNRVLVGVERHCGV